MDKQVAEYTQWAENREKLDTLRIYKKNMSKREKEGGGESDEEQDVKSRFMLVKGDKVYQSVRTEILLREKEKAKLPQERRRRDMKETLFIL